MKAAAARKKWRDVLDAPLRSNGTEDPVELTKMGQSGDRVMYEDGVGGLDDYCSITIDGSGGLSEDIIQQRLQSIVRQREELQQVEIELRAQVIAHLQIVDAQHSFEAAAKEHVVAVSKLKRLHGKYLFDDVTEVEKPFLFDDEDVGAWEAESQMWAGTLLLVTSEEQHFKQIFVENMVVFNKTSCSLFFLRNSDNMDLPCSVKGKLKGPNSLLSISCACGDHGIFQLNRFWLLMPLKQMKKYNWFPIVIMKKYQIHNR
ncbi:hypothetical protein ABZP36_035041 [Zizania latifolia]